MSNLKEIRTRIASVKSTMQITSAMKMVAAAKLRRAQDSITQMRPYANKLQEILSGINSSLSEKSQEENVYAQQRDIKKVLIVVITSNRGMCGAFNANIVKSVISLA
ncbi:MAG: FoF1 ATP synthase subunit gamma, partial [Bacteroidota bacterium]|nr:FoF1 ATP synthase subunit gamma [Bacteroidota bacterium]